MRFNTAEVRANTEQIKNEVRELSIQASIVVYEEFIKTLGNNKTLSYNEFKSKIKLDTTNLSIAIDKTLNDQVKKNIESFKKQMESHNKTKSGDFKEVKAQYKEELLVYIEAIKQDAYNKYLSMLNHMSEVANDLR